MNCKQIQQHVDDYLDGMLTSEQLIEVEQHIQQCTDCRQVYDDAKTVQNMLQNLPVVQARDGFFTEAMQQARKANGVKKTSPKKSWWIASGGGALAASLVLMSSVGLWRAETNSDVPTIANVEVALHQVRTLDVVFNSPVEIAEVTFTMTVSDNLALANYPNKKQLEWKTSLKQGRNRLSLPVMAMAEGEGEIHAVMNDGKSKKVFRMVVKVGANGVSHWQLPDGLKV